MTTPTSRTQLGEDLIGVITTLASQNDVTTGQCLDVIGILQSTFTLGDFFTIEQGNFAAYLARAKENRLDQIKIFLGEHALHQNTANHSAPAN